MNITEEELTYRKTAFLWSPWHDKRKPQPDFISPDGDKYWLDPSLTKWAREEQISWGGPMPAIDGYVYCVELTDGTRTRVLYVDNAPVEEDSNYESMATKIDKWKLVKKFDKQ